MATTEFCSGYGLCQNNVCQNNESQGVAILGNINILEML